MSEQIAASQKAIEEINKLITSQANEYNRLFVSIAALKSVLVEYQSGTIIKLRHLNDAEEDDEKDLFNKSLKEDLLKVDETRDKIMNEQSKLIDVSGKLIHEKDNLYRTVIQLLQPSMMDEKSTQKNDAPILDKKSDEKSNGKVETLEIIEEADSVEVPPHLVDKVRELIKNNGS